MTKDNICILRPIFAPFNNKDVLRTACNIASECFGIKYDFLFEQTEDAFYCSELIAFILNETCIMRTADVSQFTKRETLGVLTVTPQDYFDAKSKFSLIFLAFPTG
jgi:hypothetical protein